MADDERKAMEIQETYRLVSRSEVPALIAEAKAEAEHILTELRQFYDGDITVRVYENHHAVANSIAGDLLVDGEVCRTFDPIDLMFPELNELLLMRILDERGARE